MSSEKFCSFLAGVLLASNLVTTATAGMVTWDIDPTQSFFQLTIPDQPIILDEITVTLKMRDAASTTVWTDAGGRSARLDGTISSNLVDGSTVDFSGGQTNIFALEESSLRPDPAAFNPLNIDGSNPNGQYSGTGTALAALGGKVRGTWFILSADFGYLSITDAFFDLSNSGPISLGGGTAIAGSDTTFALSSSLVNLDGMTAGIFGQVIPDTLGTPLGVALQANTGSGSITDIGGLNRQLTLGIGISFLLIVNGQSVNATATGAIVATAMIPEPSTMALGTIGLVGFALQQTRRRRG